MRNNEPVAARIVGLNITDSQGGVIVEGAQPSTIYGLDLSGDSADDLELHITELALEQLIDPGGLAWMDLDLQVLQSAPQGASLVFGLDLLMEQFEPQPEPFCRQEQDRYSQERDSTSEKARSVNGQRQPREGRNPEAHRRCLQGFLRPVELHGAGSRRKDFQAEKEREEAGGREAPGPAEEVGQDGPGSPGALHQGLC